MSEQKSGLFGHPRGLYYLAFTETWERFSYYGMTALLTLYMVQQLFLPGHAEHVAGLAALRHVFEWRGPISDTAFASLIYGWYGGLVYFTPILGGLIADRWLGTKRTVVIGALLMAGGHLAMTFDASFLLALALLIAGSGCLKGNISAQVGRLYPDAAESLRTQGYTIFSAGINVGAVLGPLTCGGLAAAYGWHVGFGAAAGLMLLALVIYLAGQRHLPGERPRGADKIAYPPLTAGRAQAHRAAHSRRRVHVVSQRRLSDDLEHRRVVGRCSTFRWPARSARCPLLGSTRSIRSPASSRCRRWWRYGHGSRRRGREPHDVTKIGIGSLLTGLSALLFVAGALLPGVDGKTSVLWALGGYFGMGVAFLYYWPVLLALISQAAPAKLNATMMGGVFLSFFAGSVIAGWVGSFYDQMSPAAFWSIDAAIGIVGGLIVLVLARPLTRTPGAGD